MNKKASNMPSFLTASGAIDPDKLRGVVENLWCDILTLQRKAYLLSNDIETSLNEKRGRVEDDTVTLMFQRRGIDVLGWLASEVWADSANIVEQAEELLGRLEGAAA